MVKDGDYVIFNKFNRPEELIDKEWLEVDGLGGWSSQSAACINTRRYHGILVTNSIYGRRVLVSQLEEWVTYQGSTYPVSSNQYAGAIHPPGYKFIQDVGLGPAFRVRYRLGDGLLTKEILKIKNTSSTLIKYSWEGNESIELSILPLMSCRNFHSLQHKNSNPNKIVERESRGISFCPWDPSYRVFIEFQDAEVRDSFDWFYNFEYLEEKKRGLDYIEDLFSLIQIKLNIPSGGSSYISFSDSALNSDLTEVYNKNFQIAKKDFWKSDKIVDNFLDKSAKQFVIKSARGRKSIVAGYHWFEEWGRDTFITLPLIMDVIKDENEITQIFNDFLDFSRNGLIPNYFHTSNGDSSNNREEPVLGAEYNSVDALLWLVLASKEFYEKYKNINFLKEVYPKIKKSLLAYSTGTDFGIKMLEDGLLTQGSFNQQLTWMDAKVNGKPVTPRSGVAVDIQALWYNSLMIMSEYAKLVSNDSDVMYFLSKAELCKSSFRNKFFIKNSVQLADYIDGDFVDQSFRPNQLFAFSLPYSLLSVKESRLLLFEIRSRLLTNRGLRTLDTRDPEYKRVFIGGPESRDSAYHQGTVWPWLLAYYAKGVMTYAENDFRSELEYLIDDFSSHLEEGCLGSVSEVFDGDSPHLLGGTASQAWSVGAIRYCRELLK